MPFRYILGIWFVISEVLDTDGVQQISQLLVGLTHHILDLILALCSEPLLLWVCVGIGWDVTRGRGSQGYALLSGGLWTKVFSGHEGGTESRVV